MEHKLSEHSLPPEPLPRSPSVESSISNTKSVHIIDDELTRVRDDQELNEKVENLLKKKIQDGDKVALFQLAQFYFEQELYDHALVYFQRAADNGDYQAKYQLGIMYYDGLSGKEDHKKGFDNMYQVGTATSNQVKNIIPCAQYNVGRAYFEGFDVKQSDNMYQVGRATSNQVKHIVPCAQYNVGRAYIEGFDVKQSDNMYQVGKATSNQVKHIIPCAQYNVGRAYCEGFDVKQSDNMYQVGKATSNQVKHIIPCAQYNVGRAYCEGFGVKQSDNMYQVGRATSNQVKHIIPCAQYNVGRAYFEGFGVKESDNDAEKWWLLAADDGNPKASVKAQTALGMYYSRDESLDFKKAFFWHSEATGNGSLESQGVLGVMYNTGQGCAKNVDSAFECLKEASMRGNIYAMGNLVAYYYGKKLYTKAAELALKVTQIEKVEEISKATDCLPAFIAKGVAIGFFYYARCLHQGHGVKQDDDLAKKYYSKAFEYDNATAQRLQNMVTHGQI